MISLYAKGMTTGDIPGHLSEAYGTEGSRELVSKVTDAVVAVIAAWSSRPLDAGRFHASLTMPIGRIRHAALGREQVSG